VYQRNEMWGTELSHTEKSNPNLSFFSRILYPILKKGAKYNYNRSLETLNRSFTVTHIVFVTKLKCQTMFSGEYNVFFVPPPCKLSILSAVTCNRAPVLATLTLIGLRSSCIPVSLCGKFTTPNAWKNGHPIPLKTDMGLTFEEKHEYIPVLTNYRRCCILKKVIS